MDSAQTQERVAVVVVHGVADQKSGETVLQLARLLCHGAAGEPRFVRGEIQEVLVPVARLEPGDDCVARITEQEQPTNTQHHPGALSGFFQQQRQLEENCEPTVTRQDLSAELNDYLLSRLELTDEDSLYPPNGQSPRARIYSRFAALLAYVREAGYSRVVIVAHSQGTVISADLLRYLHIQRRLLDVTGAMPVSLVTVGSPLRDLYAQRFPLLYEWLKGDPTEFETAGPRAADIGAREWINVCRAGDYVGRFIWSPKTPDAFAVATLDASGQAVARRAEDRSEFCLGAGGHTRYFSNDALVLAREVERLVAASA